MYDTREKAARDHQWLIDGARNEGLEEGMEKGTLIGTIRTCQSILKMSESSQDALLAKSISELQSMASELQSALRSRVG